MIVCFPRLCFLGLIEHNIVHTCIFLIVLFLFVRVAWSRNWSDFAFALSCYVQALAAFSHRSDEGTGFFSDADAILRIIQVCFSPKPLHFSQKSVLEVVKLQHFQHMCRIVLLPSSFWPPASGWSGITSAATDIKARRVNSPPACHAQGAGTCGEPAEGGCLVLLSLDYRERYLWLSNYQSWLDSYSVFCRPSGVLLAESRLPWFICVGSPTIAVMQCCLSSSYCILFLFSIWDA